MDCINNLFNLLKEDVEVDDKTKLYELFTTIVLKWNRVEDINFALINEDILLLLNNADEFAENLLGTSISYLMQNVYVRKDYYNLGNCETQN